ncbi:transmembrane protein, putative (macronuclear) [Tetrahymena thermophila SB210]|uniref:Transmembrane protein, putative n=1 Tax=Tetrahymena thermophila (strain SB210) TaxID=312017 RepID=W7X210_TETTS|nr:transmembrane protein, putative [Tetrahymena thermophila SB210]EWS73270.1 transmembrane protein, putative [Tetrahymena thermophila SB210]|eukprot:XP_012654179.1 transmembrane protein, putative [Tetrahymena thermophila SB210]
MSLYIIYVVKRFYVIYQLNTLLSVWLLLKKPSGIKLGGVLSLNSSRQLPRIKYLFYLHPFIYKLQKNRLHITHFQLSLSSPLSGNSFLHALHVTCLVFSSHQNPSSSLAFLHSLHTSKLFFLPPILFLFQADYQGLEGAGFISGSSSSLYILLLLFLIGALGSGFFYAAGAGIFQSFLIFSSIYSQYSFVFFFSGCLFSKFSIKLLIVGFFAKSLYLERQFGHSSLFCFQSQKQAPHKLCKQGQRVTQEQIISIQITHSNSSDILSSQVLNLFNYSQILRFSSSCSSLIFQILYSSSSLCYCFILAVSSSFNFDAQAPPFDEDQESFTIKPMTSAQLTLDL